MSDNESRAAFLLAALRADRAWTERFVDDYYLDEASRQQIGYIDVLIGIVEEAAKADADAVNGRLAMRQIYDRIGALFACDEQSNHSHIDEQPAGSPYRESCAAR